MISCLRSDLTYIKNFIYAHTAFSLHPLLRTSESESCVLSQDSPETLERSPSGHPAPRTASAHRRRHSARYPARDPVKVEFDD